MSEIKPDLIVELVHRGSTPGDYRIEILIDRQRYSWLGPFETEAERQRAHADLVDMMTSQGGRELPHMRLQ